MSPAPWSDANSGLLQAVYELLCISRMNAIYCEGRLREIQRISFWMEILIAATASGSGLASFGVFSTTYGQAVWQGLSLSAAVIAIVRPIYAPAKKLELLTRQQHGYQANFFSLKKLAFFIRQKGAITDEIRSRYETVFDRHTQLSMDDETVPIRRHVNKARTMTEIEMPPNAFWWPQTAIRPAAAAQNG